ncbi:hypothetical protein Leryth_012864 [Lithospermum erythrorhizon]|nr:hypothetical protein Leryth_012864 [Lithospermum erythrorhizon]
MDFDFIPQRPEAKSMANSLRLLTRLQKCKEDDALINGDHQEYEKMKDEMELNLLLCIVNEE